jgi:hypothetical protein
MVARVISNLFLGFLLFVSGLLLFGAAGVLFFGLFRQSVFNSVDFLASVILATGGFCCTYNGLLLLWKNI